MRNKPDVISYILRLKQTDIDIIHNALTFYEKNKKEDTELMEGEETYAEEARRVSEILWKVLRGEK